MGDPSLFRHVGVAGQQVERDDDDHARSHKQTHTNMHKIAKQNCLGNARVIRSHAQAVRINIRTTTCALPRSQVAMLKILGPAATSSRLHAFAPAHQHPEQLRHCKPATPHTCRPTHLPCHSTVLLPSTRMPPAPYQAFKPARLCHNTCTLASLWLQAYMSTRSCVNTPGLFWVCTSTPCMSATLFTEMVAP